MCSLTQKIEFYVLFKRLVQVFSQVTCNLDSKFQANFFNVPQKVTCGATLGVSWNSYESALVWMLTGAFRNM